MSFAALAQALQGPLFESTCVAFDFRGHGFHYSDEDDELSIDNLKEEAIRVLKHVSEKFRNQPIIVVGHSMGGAIATKTVAELFS